MKFHSHVLMVRAVMRRSPARTNPGRLIGLMFLPVLIIGLMSACGCLQREAINGKTEVQSQIIEDITLSQALTLIQGSRGNPDSVLLDIRTPEEISAEHIENAVNLVDYYSETFRHDLDNLDKSKEYLIYCQTGRRTGEALIVMKELGYVEVYNMLGGITRWKKEGLPTTR